MAQRAIKNRNFLKMTKSLYQKYRAKRRIDAKALDESAFYFTEIC